jgi:hypothetical protein
MVLRWWSLHFDRDCGGGGSGWSLVIMMVVVVCSEPVIGILVE